VNDHGIDALDFATRSHLLVYGQRGSGRTALLRTVLRGLAARHPGVVVLELEQVPPVWEQVRAVLMRRLADRGSWQGPELFLVADDYDTVPHRTDPLLRLAAPLRHGSSIGVHLIATAVGELRSVVVDMLPEHDRMELLLSEQEPGTARFAGNGKEVRIAVDAGERPPEFRPLDDLFTTPAPEAPLLARIGVTHDGEPVHVDVRRHTWCGVDKFAASSTVVRRIAYSLATRYPPTAVQFVVAEYRVAEHLGDLAALPHTAEYLPMKEAKDAHRLTALLDDELRRRLNLNGRAKFPRLVALLDDPGLFVAMVPHFGDALRRIAAVGERLGISLVVTQWLPPERGWIGEILADLRRMAHNAVSLPEVRIAEVTREEVLEARFRARGPAVRAQPLQPPMGTFTYDELLLIAATRQQAGVPLGLQTGTERPVNLDFDREQHFVVVGAPRTGRSTVLRTILHGVAQRYTAAECAVFLLYDNMIEGVLPKEYVLATVPGRKPSTNTIDEVLTALRKRRDNPDWSGRRLFVLIDDVDLFDPAHDPLTDLRELIPYAKEIGVHFVVSGGEDILTRPDIKALAAPQLTLREDTLPMSIPGDIPTLAAVGRGELMPGYRMLSLPWCQQPTGR
jgi:hypothetical protein